MKKSGKNQKTEPAARNHLVFVSHSTYDKWIAKVVCEKLASKKYGISTFRDDRGIDGGDNIPASIKNAIRDCSEVVVFLTPSSVNRSWVNIEIGMASMLERRIIPLLYHVTPGEMPAFLKDIRAYQLDELDQFIESVRRRAAEL